MAPSRRDKLMMGACVAFFVLVVGAIVFAPPIDTSADPAPAVSGDSQVDQNDVRTFYVEEGGETYFCIFYGDGKWDGGMGGLWCEPTSDTDS